MSKSTIKKLTSLPGPVLRMKYRYFIGIDCGVETGLAIWDKPNKCFFRIESLMIHQALRRVESFYSDYVGDILVRVEDARQRKWIPRQKNEKAERGRREGAGSVKRDAKIWEDFLIDKGIPFEMVAPRRNKTKVEAIYFKKVTGWEGKTNSHARDAAFLVFGM